MPWYPELNVRVLYPRKGRMPIPVLKKQLAEAQVKKYCEGKMPPEYQNEIRMSYVFRGNSLTIIESRPGMLDQSEWHNMAIAQFRYSYQNGKWKLYCADRNGKWHVYVERQPTADLQELIDEVEDDPTCIFYG
jgi:hypothetical protein